MCLFYQEKDTGAQLVRPIASLCNHPPPSGLGAPILGEKTNIVGLL